MKSTLWIPMIPFLVAAGPCQSQDDELSVNEAKSALEEVAVAVEADALVSGTIEISTNFTIGQTVEAAAEELRSFIETQLPCAEITRENAMLSITYGALEGNCTYNGHTYTGTHTVTVKSAEEGNLVVEHTWDRIANGVISVSGDATVTWSSENASRNIAHALTWTRLSNGKTMTGRGDRTQTALTGGIQEGIEVDGDRRWSSGAGEWDLDIDHVQMRWEDPVPQSGAYTLRTPYDKTLEMTFVRRDADRISVTVSTGDIAIDFTVEKSGAITE